MDVIKTATQTLVRACIVLLLVGWLLATPILLAASGATLSDPSDAPHANALVMTQAAACFGLLVVLGRWHRKPELWMAAGVVGTWLIIAKELKTRLAG